MSRQLWEMFRPRNHPSAAELARPTVAELSAFTGYLAKKLDESDWIVYWLLVAGIKPYELEELRPGVPRDLSSGHALDLDPANHRLQRAPLWETALPKAGAYLPLTKEAFTQLQRLAENGGIPDAIESLHRASRNFQRRRGGSRMVPNALPRALPLLMADSGLPRVAIHHLSGNLPFVDKALTRYVRLNSHQIAFSLAKRCQTLAIESGVLRPPPFIVKEEPGPRVIGSASVQALDEMNRYLIQARAGLEASLARFRAADCTLEGNVHAFNAAEAYWLLILSVAFALRAPGRETRIVQATEDLAQISDKASAQYDEVNTLPIGQVLSRILTARQALRRQFLDTTTRQTVHKWPEDVLTPIFVRNVRNDFVATPMPGSRARQLLNLATDQPRDTIRHSVATWLTEHVPSTCRNYLMRHNQAAVTLDGIWSNARWSLVENLTSIQNQLLTEVGASPIETQFQRVPNRLVLLMDLPSKRKKQPRPSIIPDIRAIRLTTWLEQNPGRLFKLLKRDQLPDRQELRLFLALFLESAFTRADLPIWIAGLRVMDFQDGHLSFSVSPLEHTSCCCRLKLGPIGRGAASQLIRGRSPSDWLLFPNFTGDNRDQALNDRLSHLLRKMDIPHQPVTVSRLAASTRFLAWRRGTPPWYLTALTLDSLPATQQSVPNESADVQPTGNDPDGVTSPAYMTHSGAGSYQRAAKVLIQNLFRQLEAQAHRRKGRSPRFPTRKHMERPEVRAIFSDALRQATTLGAYANLTNALIMWLREDVLSRPEKINLTSASEYLGEVGRHGLLEIPDSADFEELDADEQAELVSQVLERHSSGNKTKVARRLARFYRFGGSRGLCQVPTDIPGVEHWSSFATRSIVISRGDLDRWLLGLPGDCRTLRMLRAAAVLGFYGGLRADEVERLRLSDCLFHRGTLEISIPEGKTDNARRRLQVAELAGPNAANALREWIEERASEFRGEANTPYVYLFGPPRRQGQCEARLVIDAVIELLREEFGPAVTFHTLRHSFANWVGDSIEAAHGSDEPDSLTPTARRIIQSFRYDGQKGEADLAEICKLMGHGSPETFIRYYWHPEFA